MDNRTQLVGPARRVKRFRVEKEARILHNILRGFTNLIVTVESGRPAVAGARGHDPCLTVIGNTNPRSSRHDA
jgi:hypothetical protein